MMHFKYLLYILKHKWYVFIECCKSGIPIRGLLHDLSKFKPSEWLPYARYFYGGNYPEWDKAKFMSTGYPYERTKEGIKSSFNYAWLHHQKRNKHHWQYWVLQRDDGVVEILDMPEKYCKEMLADWRGASRSIAGNDETNDWYEKNKYKMYLSQKTREWIEWRLRG